MKYLLLMLPLAIAACSTDYDGGYAQGYYNPAYSRYAYNEGYYGQPDYYGGENCGTPDEPKACPPLPRYPLTYYPGDRY